MTHKPDYFDVKIPAPLEPLAPSISDKNLEVLESDLAERVARLKAKLKPQQLWRLNRRLRYLWRLLNREGYNDLVSSRFRVWREYQRTAEEFRNALVDRRPAIRRAGLMLAARGRALNEALARIKPLHDEYESILHKLQAHDDAVKRDKEEAENRAAFYREKEVYEELLKAALRKMKNVHYAGKDARGREFIKIPQFETVFVSEDRMWFKILVSSQNMVQRFFGNRWSNHLPYGVLPSALTADETLHALSVATNRSVTVERGQRGQELYWVINRLDSPDGIPAKVAFSKVIQYYPKEQHALTPWPIGVTSNRRVEWLNLEDFPNVLIAGASGGGKSNELNAIIGTFVSMNSPSQLRLMLIDNKGGVEFTHWKGIPHLIGDMIKDESEVLEALQRITGVIKHRLGQFERLKAKKLSSFNRNVRPEDQLPRIVVIVDEMSTLTGLDDSEAIQHELKTITARGRAVGVHVILCTQHVSVDIVQGAIKTNMQVRASTKMPSEVASRIILDTMSAVKLPQIPGRMVFSLGRSEVVAQAPLITDSEIASTVEIARGYGAADDREFEGKAAEVREKFSRDDLIALALDEFGGKLTAEKMHESIGGNDVISLRKLKALISEVASSKTIEYRGRSYKLARLGKSAILRPIEPQLDHSMVRLQ